MRHRVRASMWARRFYALERMARVRMKSSGLTTVHTAHPTYVKMLRAAENMQYHAKRM